MRERARWLLVACLLVRALPAFGQPGPSQELALAKQRLELDRARFEHEKRISQKGVLDSPALGFGVGLAVSILTWYLTRKSEREKQDREALTSFHGELRKGRIDAYRGLWRCLLPLALYGQHHFERSDAAKLRLRLSRWYFRDGLFLAESGDRSSTRERYFALQNALVLVSNHGDGASFLAEPTDSIGHQEAKQDEDLFRSFTRWETALPATAVSSPFMQYRFLRALGSLLRTATVRDVSTRVSAVHVQPAPPLSGGPSRAAAS